MIKHKLSNGSILEITICDFSLGLKLQQRLSELAQHAGLDINGVDGDCLSKMALIGLSDDGLITIFWLLAKRCIIDSVHKVDVDYFEKVEHREVFNEVYNTVILENARPFLKPLFAELKIGEQEGADANQA